MKYFTVVKPLATDVVTAARKRIINAFECSSRVVLSLSGGKDSIVLNDLVYNLIKQKEINKDHLVVQFVDEEAIYPCVEQIVLDLRKRWLLQGVKFEWYACEFKHYNCLNLLTNDESFIVFDRTKKDVWIRQPPAFAIREHPLLDVGHDTYQSFLGKVNKNSLTLIGVRASESLQRHQMLARTSPGKTGKVYPIYDMKDTDVWKYIHDHNLPFPKAYLYMYQCGVSKKRLRISQFFSIDTVSSLVKMCEYYPHLFDKICKREQNAYLALLYYDSEFFRHANRKKTKDSVDYKAETLRMLRHPESLLINNGEKIAHLLKNSILKNYHCMNDQLWKTAYSILIAGDPKLRSVRAFDANLYRRKSNE